MPYRMRYRKTYVTLPEDPRTGVCDGCGKSVHKGEIKNTHNHHYRYAYATKTVKKNPLLALKYRLEFCFRCHQIANALRVLNENKVKRVVKVLLAHSEEFIVDIWRRVSYVSTR